MEKMWGTVLLCIFACAQLGSSQLVSNHHYNFPNMIQNIGSRMKYSRNLHSANNNSDLISTIDLLKNMLSLDQFVKFLKNSLERMDDSKCKQDIGYLLDNIKSKEMWGVKMLDAMGKPESGILEGKFKWLGDYYECTSIIVPSEDYGKAGNFSGQYCSLDIGLSVSNMTLPLTVGICIPNSCEAELGNLGEALFYKTNPSLKSIVKVNKHTCQTTSRKLSSAAIGFICLLAFFLLISLIGTAMTVYEFFSKLSEKDNPCQGLQADVKINGDVEKHEKGSCSEIPLIPADEPKGLYSSCQPFFNCFCVISNGARILNTEGSEGELLCLHGIRFLSMCWVIVCHTYAFSFAAVGNLLEGISTVDSWLFQIILNGFFSVDSFFVLSGLLLAYLFFKQAEKSNGKFPWVYAYVHRYIRLTFVYMIALGIYTTLWYYFGSGPLWTTAEVEAVCKKNWWYNILYINNFASADKQCFGWAWYLANDMQFFWISPIFLIPLLKWPVIGLSLLGVFLTASMCASFGITYHYDLFAGIGNIAAKGPEITNFMGMFAEFFDKLYIKPYIRIGPYLIGIALAYYLTKRLKSDNVKMGFIPLCCGWIVSTAVTLASLFGLYFYDLTKIENGFYNALNHSLYAMSLGWVIFVCLIGQAGPINTILSFKLFIPLSRLTYCAYLIHPMFLIGYFSAHKTLIDFSHMTLVTSFLGLLVISYFFAFLLSILFESPVIRLEKLIRSKLRK